MAKINIRQKFIELTSRTYPYGHEKDVVEKLGINLETDEHGNYFVAVGTEGDYDTMFASHLDTHGQTVSEIVHVFTKYDGTVVETVEEADIIKTDGKTNLGGDDKAGVVIMLNMIEENVPGLYYFFIGEEVGCIGSSALAKVHEKKPLPNIKKVISFDRKKNDSIITYQTGVRCCSDEFANALVDAFSDYNSYELNMKKDDTGGSTDSRQFMGIYNECTNLSIGYINEHKTSEEQDITFLENFADACAKIDWKSLPAKRDFKVVERKQYSSSTNSSVKKELTELITNDERYDYLSTFLTNEKNELVEVDFCIERGEYELSSIAMLFHLLEINHKSLKWNGVELVITYNDDSTKSYPRYELAKILKCMDLTYVEGNDDELALVEESNAKMTV